MEKIRINLANPQELCELPGLDAAKRDAILRHRQQKGPITNAADLGELLGRDAVTLALLDRIDFAPADTTAPEAPGA